MLSARHNKLSGPALAWDGLFVGETEGVQSITTYPEKGTPFGKLREHENLRDLHRSAASRNRVPCLGRYGWVWGGGLATGVVRTFPVAVRLQVQAIRAACPPARAGSRKRGKLPP